MRQSKFSIVYPVLLYTGLILAGIIPFIIQAGPGNQPSEFWPYSPPDTIRDLRFPFRDQGNYEPGAEAPQGGMYMKRPSNVQSDVIYDPETNQYVLTDKIGDFNIRPPRYASFKEYQDIDSRRSLRNYWREKSLANKGGQSDGIIPSIYIGGQAFDMIFGGSTIDIRPSGSAELIFGILANKRNDPTLNVRQRSTVNFDFQEKIQMNVIAKVGDKIEFKANYNTESTFDFENRLQLKYEGKEDEIVKLVEVGNVNLPLNSTLIQGSQSLFGIKTKLQFGRTTVTSVFSQQESETSSITVQGGAQTSQFTLKADQYEENKHFFLGQYFRDSYNQALSSLPLVKSNINLTKIEVWVTNIGAAVTENRNIIAFQDLGERIPYNINVQGNIGQPPYANNRANNLLTTLNINQVRNINTASSYLKSPPLSFAAGTDFEKIESARKLNPSEYTYNSQLGFISLNTTLNSDQTLAVAYQYTVVGDTAVYQVGEFSDGGISAPSCLMVKLLKSTSLNTHIPIWNLMMKNVYAIGAYQVNRQDFILNILYSGNNNGVPTGYLTETIIAGIPLIRVMGLDNLDPLSNPPPDGIFDFIDNASTQGGTINSSNGRIFFPVLEPFGKDLRIKINDDKLADKYCYDSLYTNTKVGAQQYPEKNKFVLEGFFKSSSSNEISLNALNVPQGSVKVTHGGIPLTENVDYTVDYTLGRVKIINEALISSGTPINISLESNSMFSIQSKTYMGTHVDYMVNKDFMLGATIINLTERPLTQKTILGEDPISNTIWGFNFNYSEESLLLTKLVDKLPFIETNVPSKVMVSGEFAHFIPGHSSAIGSSGTSYIDDFEAAKSSIDLKLQSNWFLASTPQGQTNPGLFPEGAIGTGLAYGYNRAALSWYIIDPLFYDRYGNLRPKNITPDELSRNSVRQVLENEVFPAKQIPNGTPTNIAVLNVDYYPNERGPYNYDVDGVAGLSKGLKADGTLEEPRSRWGGIMRKIESTDFEATNVEYVEFWMMDPFVDNPDHPGGDMYFHLGDISEDILRDGKKSFENGMPISGQSTDVDTTIWGRVPRLQSLVNAFDNNPNSRQYQDIGYDGLSDADEKAFFDGTYLQKIIARHGAGSDAYTKAAEDPSGDNYHYFRGSDYDELEAFSNINVRYKKFQGSEGNSPTAEQAGEAYPTLATTLPNVEDINYDNTLWEDERYFQYKINLRPDKMIIGENYIADIYTARDVYLENGNRGTVRWYQFKVPVSDPEKIVGNIQDFKSIRFMRMIYKNFDRPIITRFATFELVRGDWRRYKYDLLSAGEYIPNDEQGLTKFEVSTVNIEENGSKQPVPYVIPPGIEREINYGTTNFTRLNEQAMVLRVKDLQDGDARAAYKTTGFDFRQYKTLKMFVHAEDLFNNQKNSYGDLTVFIRMGADFTQNYYEYEIPLTFTAWGTTATNLEAIWPTANAFDVNLENLVNIKQDRNITMRQNGTAITLNTPFVVMDGLNKITIVGTPSLSDVRAIMIGIRNPKRKSLNDPDDGNPKSAEIWVNELRLSDFDNKSGWAATGRITANLADLGNVAFSASHSTPGFGSIEKKVNERQKEAITTFDFATNLQLGKFFPEKYGIRIPMHFDYSQNVISPEYNPLDPDVKLAEEIASYKTDPEKDSIRSLTQDFTSRKNLNFMNVRKDRVGATSPPKPWDVENFDFTYAYSEVDAHNIDIEYDNKTMHRGGVGYNYMIQPQNYRPLSNVSAFQKSKSLALIRDFNFYLLPKLFSFRMDMNREYTERKLRNKSTALVIIDPSYIKSFVWTRMYDFKYDLTQGLKFEFNANANAFIDELPGSVDNDDYGHTVGEKKDRIREEILGFGTMNRYNQQYTINYAIPINKIPLFSWINATARYQGTYSWSASPKSVQDILGNSIENSNSKQLNANLRFTTLYNKVPFLKRMLASDRSPQKGTTPGRPENPRNPSKPAAVLPVTAKDSIQPSAFAKFMRGAGKAAIKLVLSLQDGSISYTETNGTLLPGFTKTPGLIGNDFSSNAPGLGFVFGSQNDIRYNAAADGWLTQDTLFNSAYATKYSATFTARIQLEPVEDLRIELTANRTHSTDHQEYFKVRDNNFTSFSPVDHGSFNISFITFATAFSGTATENSSSTFDNMKDNRMQIALRLAEQNPTWKADPQFNDTTGFPVGYGPTSQDVLHYSFIAAYSGKTPGSVALNAFPRIPLPNWRITYKGIGQIPKVKEYFREVTLNHSYRSSYSVGNYATNVLFSGIDGQPGTYDAIRNFIPEFQISQISISEQFVPLFGIDMTWKNNVLSRFEIRKSRALALSFVNNQLTEVSSDEIVIGIGYRFKDVELIFKGGGGAGQKFKSDLNLKADFAIKTNKTLLRRIEEDVNQISAGQKQISVNTSADYQMNQRVSVRLFVDWAFNNPFVSNQYSNSNTNGGISIRFTLAQ
ncbi:MAG: cell surface protein SprA [Bacteroidales bacterium]|nr:cell surface protein SprA [Bacteroidales bacterium]